MEEMKFVLVVVLVILVLVAIFIVIGLMTHIFSSLREDEKDLKRIRERQDAFWQAFINRS